MTGSMFTLRGVPRSRFGAWWRRVLPVLALLAGAPSVRAVTEAYDTQTANINQLRTEKNNSPPYAGTFDSGSDLAQYANGGWFGNTPGAAAFRTFTIDGANENAAARVLYPGDRFTITANVSANPSAGGAVAKRTMLSVSAMFANACRPSTSTTPTVASPSAVSRPT